MIPHAQRKADTQYFSISGYTCCHLLSHRFCLLGVCHQHAYILEDSAFLFTVDCEIWITVLSASLCLQQVGILRSIGDYSTNADVWTQVPFSTNI